MHPLARVSAPPHKGGYDKRRRRCQLRGQRRAALFVVWLSSSWGVQGSKITRINKWTLGGSLAPACCYLPTRTREGLGAHPMGGKKAPAVCQCPFPHPLLHAPLPLAYTMALAALTLNCAPSRPPPLLGLSLLLRILIHATAARCKNYRHPTNMPRGRGVPSVPHSHSPSLKGGPGRPKSPTEQKKTRTHTRTYTHARTHTYVCILSSLRPLVCRRAHRRRHGGRTKELRPLPLQPPPALLLLLLLGL